MEYIPALTCALSLITLWAHFRNWLDLFPVGMLTVSCWVRSSSCFMLCGSLIWVIKRVNQKHTALHQSGHWLQANVFLWRSSMSSCARCSQSSGIWGKTVKDQTSVKNAHDLCFIYFHEVSLQYYNNGIIYNDFPRFSRLFPTFSLRLRTGIHKLFSQQNPFDVIYLLS